MAVDARFDMRGDGSKNLVHNVNSYPHRARKKNPCRDGCYSGGLNSGKKVNRNRIQEAFKKIKKLDKIKANNTK